MSGASAIGKIVRCATGAYPCCLDIFGPEAAFSELVPGNGPEVEIVSTVLKYMHPLRKLLAVVLKFRAAGTKRWTDDGFEQFGPGGKVLCHAGNGFSNDVVYAASPTAMDSSDHFVFGVVEENRLAVCLLNEQARCRQVGDHGIHAVQVGLGGVGFEDRNTIGMGLMCGIKVLEVQALLDTRTVSCHGCSAVANTVTQIEAPIGRLTFSPMAREHTMGDGKKAAGVVAETGVEPNHQVLP